MLPPTTRPWAFWALLLLGASLQLPHRAAVAPTEPADPDAAEFNCGCSYGTAPGMWVKTGSQGEGWASLDGDCTTTNLLYALAAARPARSQPLHVLLFGDSVDGCVMNAWCGYVRNVTSREQEQWPPFRWHDRLNLSYCQTLSRMDLAHYFSVGVHPAGPYFENNSHNYTVRLQLARAHLRQRWGTDQPDIVITSAGLWDIARLLYVGDEEWEAWGRPENRIKLPFLDQHLALPRGFVDSWVRNMTHMVASVRATFPQALVMTHTTANVCHDPDGRACSRPLGRLTYIQQLNAAVRQVAAVTGAPLVDFERMSTGISRYLLDGHHPNDDFLLEALNLFLNTYEQHRRCGTLPAGNRYAARAAGAAGRGEGGGRTVAAGGWGGSGGGGASGEGQA